MGTSYNKDKMVVDKAVLLFVGVGTVKALGLRDANDVAVQSSQKLLITDVFHVHSSVAVNLLHSVGSRLTANI